MFEETDSVFPQTFRTNPSKLRIYLCKIPTVITETFIVQTKLNNLVVFFYKMDVSNSLFKDT
jgi:hypothetical protein